MRVLLLVLLICVLGLLLWKAPLLLGRALYNVAELALLHGRGDQQLFEVAYALAHSDERVAWQTGIAFARFGDFEKASAVLGPLLRPLQSNATLTDAMLRDYLNVVVANQQTDEAYRIYVQANSPQALSPGGAAAILAYATEAGLPLTTKQYYRLTAGLFGIDSQREDVAAALDFALATPEMAPQLQAQLSDIVKWRRLPLQNADLGLPITHGCDPETVARSLNSNVAVESANLILNGDFERYDPIRDSPSDWTPVYASQGPKWNTGAFAIGVDPTVAYSGDQSMRMEGLLVSGSAGMDSARAGYQAATVDLSPNSSYLLCLLYRDNGVDEPIASLQFGETRATSLQEDYFLPPSGGGWKRVVLLFTVQRDAQTLINPLLRIWKTGAIWIDNVALYRISDANFEPDSELKIIVQDAPAPISGD